MSPAEFVAQEHAYNVLKRRILERGYEIGPLININALTDEIGIGRTPMREALFRLVGEGLVESAGNSGYRLFRPAAPELHDLYVWNSFLVLGAVHAVRDEALARIIEVQGSSLAKTELLSDIVAAAVVSRFFQSVADATGNRDISRQVQHANERLASIRRVESRVLSDLGDEVRRMLSVGRFAVRKNVRRKILGYNRRRIVHQNLIAIAIDAEFNR